MNSEMLSHYYSHNEQLCSWLGGHWNNIDALAAWPGCSQQWPQRPQLVEILSQAAQSCQASPQSLQHIKALQQDDCFAVICGQQPALGGGPLYTLIKAAQTVAVSQQLRHIGVNAVPLFWCASEDHDEGEGSHADLLSRDGSLHRVHVPFDRPGASLHYQNAAVWWPALISSLEQHADSGLGSSWLRQQEPEPEENYGAWLCRLLHQLFASRGLICCEAREFRPLWHPRLGQIIDRWPSLPLAKRRQDVMAAGYPDSFDGHLHSPPLFIDDENKRRPISPDEARTRYTMQHNLNLSDLTISSGAALRPIIQQLCLPGLAFIGGPGELQYHLLLGPAYDALQAIRPRFIPRSQISLVPGPVQRAIEAWGLSADAIHADSTAPQLPDGEERIEKLVRELDNRIFHLGHQETSDDDLRQRLKTGSADLQRALDRFKNSLQRSARKQRQLPAFGTVTNYLFPRGKPQDRVMNMCQAIWEFGPGIADEMVQACSGQIAQQRLFIQT